MSAILSGKRYKLQGSQQPRIACRMVWCSGRQMKTLTSASLSSFALTGLPHILSTLVSICTIITSSTTTSHALVALLAPCEMAQSNGVHPSASHRLGSQFAPRRPSRTPSPTPYMADLDCCERPAVDLMTDIIFYFHIVHTLLSLSYIFYINEEPILFLAC